MQKELVAGQDDPQLPSLAIGSFFRNKRVGLKISEWEVTNYLGDITVEVLRAYEEGKREIPLTHIYSISNCLNISPREIMTLIDEEVSRLASNA